MAKGESTKRLYDFLKPKDLGATKRAVKAIRHGVKVLEAGVRQLVAVFANFGFENAFKSMG